MSLKANASASRQTVEISCPRLPDPR